MINKISKIKEILNPSNLLVLFFFLLTIFSLSLFETFSPVKYFLYIVSIVLIYQYFTKNKIEFLVYPALYLVFFSSYSIYYSLNWSLWSVLLFLIISLNIIIYFVVNNMQLGNSLDKLNNNIKYFYFALYNLLLVEVFLTLIPWPTDPRGKAIILLVVFYIIEGLVLAWQNKKFVFNQVYQYFTIGLLIIFAIIITTTWYAY